MNAKQAVNEIKSVLAQFGLVSAPKQSFKLEDETILQAEKIEEGAEVEKINEQFEISKVEDGAYKTKDGFSIEVKDSKIVAIKKEAFLEAKLEDGTKIKVEGDELIEGAKVVVMQEDAEVPAPDGIHSLEDGVKVETKDGAIVGISKPKPEEDEVEDSAVEGPDMVEMVSLMKDFIKKMDEKMGGMQKKMEAMENQFSAFKSEPAAKKIADGKTEINKEVSTDELRVSKLMQLRELSKK